MIVRKYISINYVRLYAVHPHLHLRGVNSSRPVRQMFALVPCPPHEGMLHCGRRDARVLTVSSDRASHAQSLPSAYRQWCPFRIHLIPVPIKPRSSRALACPASMHVCAVGCMRKSMTASCEWSGCMCCAAQVRKMQLTADCMGCMSTPSHGLHA